MNDISNELKVKWISRALEQLGFEEMPAPGIFARQNNENKILVDLNEKQPCAIFIVGTERVAKDDDNNTLLTINQIIVDAESGVMPGDNEQESIPEQPGDGPSDPIPTAPENVPAVPEAPQALTSLQNNTDIVRPVVSATQAIAAWKEFQDLQKAILEPSDLQRIQGKDFKKKSAWRKFAAFFNLNDKIVEETQTPHQDGQGWTWKIKVICTAPNGRFTEGVGICSTSERTFAHLEHDTYATAHTRAKNRAISDMVAAGEVSAEEVST